MKIKESVLRQIIKEEVANFRRLSEEPGKEEKDDKPDPGKTSVSDASKDKKKGDKTEPQKTPDNTAGGKKDKKTPPSEETPEVDVPEDPEADPELEKDVATDDDEEDSSEVTGGDIADQIAGMSIQSVTMEPKSKVMPGAQEIVFTFTQKPDPLRILVTSTGTVKFFYKGLHNKL